MSLDADLSLPLSVSLGEAKFTGKDCSCDAGADAEQGTEEETSGQDQAETTAAEEEDLAADLDKLLDIEWFVALSQLVEPLINEH